jgi:hypothetical protein
MSDAPLTPAELREALKKPFDVGEVKWKPQVVKGNRAQAIAYIDARVVMDRLDDVFGVGGWEDRYEQLPNDSVVCTLRARVGSEWVTHQDVGSPSEQPDGGDRTKAAFSDGLKRAAVHYGVGRYLYRLPVLWLDYDPVKRKFLSLPELPTWAYPDGLGRPKDNLKAAVEGAAAKLGEGITGPQLTELQEFVDALSPSGRDQLDGKLRHQYKVKSIAELKAADARMMLHAFRLQKSTVKPTGEPA